MKTTVTIASAFCLFAASTVVAFPAVAAESDVSAPVSGVHAPAVPDPVVEEVAVRVQDKARFAASVAPVVSRVLFESGEYYRRGLDFSAAVISALWDLRFTPAIQKKWLDKLTAAAKASDSETKREATALREFLAFMDETERFMRETPRRRPGTLWMSLRGMTRAVVKGGDRSDPAVRMRNAVAARLAIVKTQEKTFARAAELTDFAMEAGIPLSEIREHPALFMRIKHSPEAVELAVSILRNNDIPEKRGAMMLRKLPEDVDAVRKDLSDLKKDMEDARQQAN